MALDPALRHFVCRAVFLTVATAVLLVGAPAASAMPPAQGLSGAQARAAERILDAAHDRGIGSLPASPFLTATACGRATTRVARLAAGHRRALVTLRRARHAGYRTGTAARRVTRLRAALRRASATRRRTCTPVATRTGTVDDEVVSGTVTTERPRSIVSGRGMVIALPVDFADVPARRASHAPDRYRDLLFDPAYPHGGGSLATFFAEMSYGSFTVDGDVGAWRRMPKRRAQYAVDAGGMGTYPGNSQSLLEDAVRANDAAVNFARFDNDGPDGLPNSGDDDGFVDSVFLIYAGTSAAENGDLDALWPHAWHHAVVTRDASANGGVVRVNRYAALPERMDAPGPDGDLLTVGVAAHEYGHVLGLPDLVDGEHGAGPGQWDLMGSGVWGVRHSSRPTGLSAWSRARLGWITPQLLEGDHVGHRLGSSYRQRTTVKLPIAGKPLHEHYLVERRTRTGFDADLPGDGLLVWHVDDSVAAGDASAHPRVELVAADGAANGDAGDLLTAGRHLSDSSSPSTRAHDGDSSLVAIQNVADVTVDLHAGQASLAPAFDREIDIAGPQAAPPTASVTTPAAGARLRATVTVTCFASGSPNINRVQFVRDGAGVSAVAVNPSEASVTRTYAWDTTTVADGAHTIGCRARNTSNQWSTVSEVSVTVDNTVPGTPTITAPATGAWVRGTVTFSGTGTDNYGVTAFSWRVDGVDAWEAPTAEASPKTGSTALDTTLLADGARTLTVLTTDLAGNVSALSASVPINIDNAAPAMGTPDDGPAAPDLDQQGSASALEASWSAGTDGVGSGVASYTWRFCTAACGSVVASGTTTGTSATAASLSLADGTYYACVTPIDVVGNQGVEQCSDGVLVDSTAPTTSVPLDGSASPDVDTQASATSLDATWPAADDGLGTGVASYDWRFCTTVACGTILAAGSGTGPSASATGLTLANGATYYACMRASDQIPNTSVWKCSDGVTVDSAGPIMPVPDDGASAPDIDFQASTSTLAASWAAPPDPSGVTSYDWRFCTDPACGTVLGAGSGATLTASVGSLSLTDGASSVACVRATDGLGNVGGWTCSDGVVVDTVAPALGVPDDGTAADIDSQTSTSELAANWAPATDGAGSGTTSYAWQICDSPACTTVLSSGSGSGTSASATGLALTVGTTYYACVRAVDAVANTSAPSCSDGVIVAADTTAPTASHSGVTGTVSGSVSFQSSSSDAGGIDYVEYRVDGTTRATAAAGGATSFTDPGTPFDTTSLLDGNHGWRAVVFDLAGNSTTTAPGTAFIVNNDPNTGVPTGTVTAPANGSMLPPTNVDLSVDVAAGDVIVRIEWLLDGLPITGLSPDYPLAGFQSGVRTKTWANTSGVPAGAHTISARLTDASGDVADTPVINVTK